MIHQQPCLVVMECYNLETAARADVSSMDTLATAQAMFSMKASARPGDCCSAVARLSSRYIVALALREE